MPLRLTGTSLEEQSITRPEITPAELQSRARLALGAADFPAYLKLFSEAGEIEHPIIRFQARRELLEAGFGALQGTSPSQAAAIYETVADAALTLLEDEPREPVLLNYAGVALYELWCLDGARKLFEAAKRLNPELAHVDRNIKETVQRNRTNSRRPFNPALRGLATRAKRVAVRAKPATGLTLSLCMIVRDEEEMLPRCLDAAADAVDELIIVDTGSTDRTVEIASSYGAKVIDHEWTGSFSDARNVSFEAATGDWILYLDADEVLDTDDISKLRTLTGQVWWEAFYLVETNYTGESDDGMATVFNALRVFRNRPQYRFEGRLHEQIAQHLSLERMQYTTIRVEHYGYLGAVRDSKEKSRRNIDLLLAQQAESPETPFLHFNLGSEYAAAGDAPSSLREFERAWEMVREATYGSTHEFTPTLLVRLVKALRFCGRPQDAISEAETGLQWFPGFTDLVFEQAQACLVLGDEERAIGYLEQCIELGDAPSKYTAQRGCGTYLPRITIAELHLRHHRIGEARELLDWCLTHHPEFYGPVLPYATALLSAGEDPAEVAAEIERRVVKVTPTVRFMLGTALYEAKALEAAERQFRLVLEAQPYSAQARVALGETLLSERRYADAAEVAAAIDDASAHRDKALRTELFARIADGDLDGATKALQRSDDAGLTEPERRLFEAWVTVAGGGTPAELELQAVPLLGVILEALLRVQEFKLFEQLLPVLKGSALAEREQRELLGMLYLRRGFLESAHDEWKAVMDEQPDARALSGLAMVAEQAGMREEARTFAQEALSLDPGMSAAQGVLDRSR